jgi:5-methyltetrahydropteroyltriglutamate--homocysteine methyltransferase
MSIESHNLDRPNIETSVVGSFPLPKWLTQSASQEAILDAIKATIKDQENVGLDLISDGEIYRSLYCHEKTNGMIDHYTQRLAGISTECRRSLTERVRNDPELVYRDEPAGVVVGEIDHGLLDLRGEFERSRQLTKHPLKFTFTGPHMLSRVLINDYYTDHRSLAMAIARVLSEQVCGIHADFVQIDEASIGGHPQDIEWAVEAINVVAKAIPGRSGIHICYGNYGGQTVQEGNYEVLLPKLLELDVDGFVLEFARRGYDELKHFAKYDSQIEIGLGVIDIKDLQIETPDLVAKRIEIGASIIGVDRLHVVPDCGLWMLPRSVTLGKLENLVKGRDLFLRE